MHVSISRVFASAYSDCHLLSLSNILLTFYNMHGSSQQPHTAKWGRGKHCRKQMGRGRWGAAGGKNFLLGLRWSWGERQGKKRVHRDGRSKGVMQKQSGAESRNEMKAAAGRPSTRRLGPQGRKPCPRPAPLEPLA